MIDNLGRRVLQGTLEGENNDIDISTLSTGMYDLIIAGYEDDIIKLGVK